MLPHYASSSLDPAFAQIVETPITNSSFFFFLKTVFTRTIALDKLLILEFRLILKAHLHDIHFKHGSPNFWHVGLYRFGHGPLDLHRKACASFLNVYF